MSIFKAGDVTPKDPSEIKNYTMDWTKELNDGATIETSSWSIFPTSLTEVSNGIVTGNKKTSVKVSGGQSGTEYSLANTITTSDGETLKQTGIVLVAIR